MGRTPCCDKANVKKGPWSPEEDAKLKDYIHKHGTGGNWISLPQKSGLKRCGKSCRLRWLNYLRPDIKHGDFSEEEDALICNLFATIGSRWSVIAAQLPGRTDNDIKNYWNTKLKKKLMSINNNNNIIPRPPHQIKNPPFIHQHSSTNSSSSSSPSSYSYSYSDHSSPIWSFSNLDPMISIFSPNNSNNNNNLVNPTTPLLFPQETSFNMMSPMVRASCSSNSDGSGENQSYQEPPLLYYGSVLEEIKQLISTSTACTNFLFDDQNS